MIYVVEGGESRWRIRYLLRPQQPNQPGGGLQTRARRRRLQTQNAGDLHPRRQTTDVDRGPDSRIHVSIRDEVRERTAQSRTCSRKHACETVEKSARPQVFMAPGLKLR